MHLEAFQRCTRADLPEEVAARSILESMLHLLRLLSGRRFETHE